MKKIIDKIINEEERIKEKENDKEVSIGCHCCCSSSESTPLATITTDKKVTVIKKIKYKQQYITVYPTRSCL